MPERPPEAAGDKEPPDGQKINFTRWDEELAQEEQLADQPAETPQRSLALVAV
jgi:hypothetical protein